jgi:glyoxylase I family protein
MRGLVHHVVLTVRDPETSAPFYDAVLGFLGYRREQGFEWEVETSGHLQSVGLVKASGAGADRVHDRYAPGLHHIAWRAESRSDVDQLHRRLLEIGATVLDAPADYPQYNKGRGYYAVFFTDLDGLKLEYVHTPVG